VASKKELTVKEEVEKMLMDSFKKILPTAVDCFIDSMTSKDVSSVDDGIDVFVDNGDFTWYEDFISSVISWAEENLIIETSIKLRKDK
jgi:hypothetical protein